LDFPTFKTQEFGPYTDFEPQFRVHVYNFEFRLHK